MSIKVLYFAGLREEFGCAGESVDLPDGVANVAALRDHLVANGRGALATAKNLRCAVNQEMASADAVLKAGDEVAFFPPVTGG
ncbi:MAG: molybdopterin converting factor subunit 1 [Rhodocyclaceae bacterium]|nr:molybdopterin converting factor subunit 1 [Rhodocyclaceae bacterium]